VSVASTLPSARLKVQESLFVPPFKLGVSLFYLPCTEGDQNSFPFPSYFLFRFFVLYQLYLYSFLSVLFFLSFLFRKT